MGFLNGSGQRKGLSLAVPESPDKPITSLYVHVPFCARKCLYCAFFSEPAEEEVIERFIGALIREMESVAPRLKPRTVFFGGGTPSFLSVKQWERLLQAMERLNLLGAEEWTVECNPATVSAEKARLFRSFGINRLSLGVQSLNDHLLEKLGRVHTRQMVFESFDLLRQAGFDNLNLDLMFAIPGQTLEAWRETLCEITALESEHLSSYELTYEEDTEFFSRLKAGKFTEDEDLACAMYEELLARAAQAGLEQYEVSNFARAGDVGSQRERPGSDWPKLACLHNVNYWRGGSFFGLGPSASSYIRGVRTKNVANTKLYCERLESGQSATESREDLPPLARAGELAAFGLRMVAGWPFGQFQTVAGFDLRQEWAGDMTLLIERGWGRLTPERFQLTPLGMRFADAAAQLFLR